MKPAEQWYALSAIHVAGRIEQTQKRLHGKRVLSPTAFQAENGLCF
jgi:hypothetical protein